MNEIASCMTYEFKPANHTIFDFGSIGDKFYIILEGMVSVLLPNPKY